MNSILIIRGGALGDFVVTLPACRLLREAWPTARIEFLGNTTFGELGRQRYYFDETRSLERGSLARFFAPRAELDPDWCDYFSEFDLIISYLYDPDDFFHTNLSRCTLAQVIRGNPQIRETLAAQHLCTPLLELELITTDFSSQIHGTPEDYAIAQNHLSRFGAPVLAFHPGSGSRTKNLPSSQWKKLLTAAEAMGYTTLLLAGEAEQERWPELSVLSKNHAVGLPLPHLAAVLKKCRVFVGHDSGVTHLAAATGIPTIALFGPTDPKVWAPPGDHVTILNGGADWAALDMGVLLAKFRSLI